MSTTHLGFEENHAEIPTSENVDDLRLDNEFGGPERQLYDVSPWVTKWLKFGTKLLKIINVYQLLPKSNPQSIVNKSK